MYQDEQYIATYDKLRLHFFADSLKMAAEGISEEIEMLWEDYVEADVDELSEDAIEFREELISMFNRKDNKKLTLFVNGKKTSVYNDVGP